MFDTMYLAFIGISSGRRELSQQQYGLPRSAPAHLRQRSRPPVHQATFGATCRPLGGGRTLP